MIHTPGKITANDVKTGKKKIKGFTLCVRLFGLGAGGFFHRIFRVGAAAMTFFVDIGSKCSHIKHRFFTGGCYS